MKTENKTIIIDTPDGIQAFRMLALKAMLKLEIAGLGRRGQSAYSIIKKEFGLRGSKRSVFDQYVAHLKAIGVLVEA